MTACTPCHTRKTARYVPRRRDERQVGLKILLSAFHNLVECDSNFMRRGDPVDLKEQSGNRKGDVGEHEQREREEIRNDTPLLLAVDMAKLRDRREQTHDKKRPVHVGKRHKNGAKTHAQLTVGCQKAMRKRTYEHERTVGKNRDERQQHARRNRHHKVVRGKTPKVKQRFEQMATVSKKDLVEAFSPAHALLP